MGVTALSCVFATGAAKPREQIIAERLGKTEEEVLKEAVKKERPKLRLNAEQLEQRRQAEVSSGRVSVRVVPPGRPHLPGRYWASLQWIPVL